MSSDRHSALLRGILESPQDIMIFALDREYRYMAFNRNHARTMKHIWGVDLKIGACMLDLIGRPDDRARAQANFDRALAGESFTVIEEYGDERINRRFYEDVYSPILDDEGGVIGLTVYLTDVTDQRQAEMELEQHRNHLEELVHARTKELEDAHAQLLYVQKLESLGVLAGGIAHDFNNLLAVILGRTELAMGTASADECHQHLDVVVETALEARALTRQLLGYAGRGKFMVQPAALSTVIEDLAQVLRASVSKSIVLEYELASDLLPVEVDLTQIRQVLLNLVSNAADAIGDRHGTIKIRTYETDVDANMLRRACLGEGVVPGRYVAMEVEDSGCGMDERVRSRLFDPFFTTKRVGRGLGLAAVYGIVTSHRGGILLDSSPGHGSRFVMLFQPSSTRELPCDPASVRPQSPDLTGCGAIMVVDDEQSVRSVAEAVLSSIGYEVVSAQGGHEALERLRGPRSIAMVLLDLTMPHLDGRETLRSIRALRPELPVILMTGYTEDEVHLPHMHEHIDGFLAKPFSKLELIDAIASAWAKSRRDRVPAASSDTG